MAQLLIRQIPDEDMVRLKARAKAQRTSVEALAREALRREAGLSSEAKLVIVSEMLAATKRLSVPGAMQTPGSELIRETRDER